MIAKPDPKSQDQAPEGPTPEGPALEEQDWEALGGDELEPESINENGDIRYAEDEETESPEEDDDNPYQESDEALPDEREEKVLRRNPGEERRRFDDV